MMDEAVQAIQEEMAEKNRIISEESADQMIDEMAEMISEFGEEELKELEEMMQMLEDMEIVDPHMSKKDLEELKRKHRSEEEKVMIKADMDYLKDMIKHTLEKGGGIHGISSGSAIVPATPMPAMTFTPNVPDILPESSPQSPGLSLDIHV
jgi:hypothetical protein